MDLFTLKTSLHYTDLKKIKEVNLTIINEEEVLKTAKENSLIPCFAIIEPEIILDQL